MTELSENSELESKPTLTEVLLAAQNALKCATAALSRAQAARDEAEKRRQLVAAEAIMGNKEATKLLKAATQDRDNALQSLEDAQLAIEIASGRVFDAEHAVALSNADGALQRVLVIGAQRTALWATIGEHLRGVQGALTLLDQSRAEVHRERATFITGVPSNRSAFLSIADEVHRFLATDTRRFVDILRSILSSSDINNQLANSAGRSVCHEDPCEVEHAFWQNHQTL